MVDREFAQVRKRFAQVRMEITCEIAYYYLRNADVEGSPSDVEGSQSDVNG